MHWDDAGIDETRRAVVSSELGVCRSRKRTTANQRTYSRTIGPQGGKGSVFHFRFQYVINDVHCLKNVQLKQIEVDLVNYEFCELDFGFLKDLDDLHERRVVSN